MIAVIAQPRPGCVWQEGGCSRDDSAQARWARGSGCSGKVEVELDGLAAGGTDMFRGRTVDLRLHVTMNTCSCRGAPGPAAEWERQGGKIKKASVI